MEESGSQKLEDSWDGIGRAKNAILVGILEFRMLTGMWAVGTWLLRF